MDFHDFKKPRRIMFPWGCCKSGYHIIGSKGELWFEPVSDEVKDIFPLDDDTSLFHNISEVNFNNPDEILVYIHNTGLSNGKGMERESVLDWQDFILQIRERLEKWDGRKIDELAHEFNGLKIGGTHTINLNTELEKDYKTGKYKPGAIPLMYLQPKTLFEAIWIQFAQAVEDNIPQYECHYCKKWFIPSREESRYCSVKCRMD